MGHPGLEYSHVSQLRRDMGHPTSESLHFFFGGRYFFSIDATIT